MKLASTRNSYLQKPFYITRLQAPHFDEYIANQKKGERVTNDIDQSFTNVNAIVKGLRRLLKNKPVYNASSFWC